jgi:DNA-binding MurR/RpiR family transcriptional regulator
MATGDFDKTWDSYKGLWDVHNELRLLDEIHAARNIVFVAKGRVGLVTKMFMQRLWQWGIPAFHSEDLNVPRLDETDLVIFVTASGNTKSSLAYIEIAKDAGARTCAVTFNRNGKIPKQCNVIIDYKADEQYTTFMKSYYEVGFLYIFERLTGHLDKEKFIHTNFE